MAVKPESAASRAKGWSPPWNFGFKRYVLGVLMQLDNSKILTEEELRKF